jgi:hypothetical protein
VKLLLRDVEKAKRTALKANTQLSKDMSSWIAKSVEGAGTEHGAVGIDTTEVSKGEAVNKTELE